MTMSPTDHDPPERWRQLALLAVTQWLAMTLWFSASAVTRLLKDEWQLSSAGEAWLTISVQMGFVLGTLLSAIFNLADRWSLPRLMAVSAVIGALANGVIAMAIAPEFGSTTTGILVVVGLRMLTGVALAGVYPTGMKLMATWFQRGRGLAIGFLVGALTLGSATPHLAAAFAVRDWRLVLQVASLAALVAAVLAATVLRTGPRLAKAAAFDWSYFAKVWLDPALRRANFGYLGHMFELYAMWAWAPKMIAESFRRSGVEGTTSAAISGFAVVAVGAIGCVVAGLLADRQGRTTITIASLLASGSCALAAGWLLDQPALLVVVCLVWGLTIVADSAQFSTAISELCNPRFVGTALTIQTCAGFLLTTVTIRLVPTMEQMFGWPAAFSLLALGPLFGIWHMARLRAMPEASRMAGGNR